MWRKMNEPLLCHHSQALVEEALHELGLEALVETGEAVSVIRGTPDSYQRVRARGLEACFGEDERVEECNGW